MHRALARGTVGTPCGKAATFHFCAAIRTAVHTDFGELHLLRTPIGNLVTRLNPDQFVRIHGSTIVNLDRIREVTPWFHGEQIVKLKDGTELALGRAFRRQLLTGSD